MRSIELASAAGLRVWLLDLGARIQSISVPLKAGRANVVVGYAHRQDYWHDTAYLGATVGRYANRIARGRFSLDGVTHQLAGTSQAGGHCLHGGPDGFHRQRFEARKSADGRSAEFRYLSPAGECGFSGTLRVLVAYRLIDDGSLAIDFEATTDASTVVNLANHAYFNLNGTTSTIDNHQVRVVADCYTPVRADLIPTGEILAVEATRFDLRQSTSLRGKEGNGEPVRFDHNFVLPDHQGAMRLAAELYSPASGVGMQLHTTQPGLQLYTGDYLDEPFRPRQGLCLEAQGFPDAPNQPSFPTTRLEPGGVYRQRTVYAFRF